MSVAHDALHCVFQLHAGFLQSYERDESQRLLKSSHIVQEAEDRLHDFMDTVQHRHPREALALIQADTLPRIQQTVDLLLQLAPNFVSTLQRPHDIETAADVMSTLSKEIEIRMGKTQYKRAIEVMRMIEQFYQSPAEPPYTVMANFARRIKYILPEITSTYLVEAADDGHLIHETWRILNSKMYKVDTKTKKKRKKKGKKGITTTIPFLERLD